VVVGGVCAEFWPEFVVNRGETGELEYCVAAGLKRY